MGASMSPARKYKDYRIYSCLILNRLVSALDIDLNQPMLEEKLDEIMVTAAGKGLTKGDIIHEIRSNHTMTNKILESLVDDGLVTIQKGEKSYEINITKDGIIHVRKFNEFYKKIYSDQIEDHYKFTGKPGWAEE
jgi:predicted transcriptional regulator